MNTPNYAVQLVRTMQDNNESPNFIVGYLQALITGFQRDAEVGDLTPKRLLEDLSRACEVTTDRYNRSSN